MNFDVAASPNDENGLEEFRFTLVACGETLNLRLVRFRIYRREDEQGPWQTSEEWQYPDLAGVSTIARPEVPDWAKADAKTLLFQHISFQ